MNAAFRVSARGGTLVTPFALVAYGVRHRTIGTDVHDQMLTISVPRITVTDHLDDEWAVGAMRDDVERAFRRRPIVLPPKWLYDDRGSEIFEQITRLPDYYPTEAERTLLIAHASDIASATEATTIVELGSGTSDKTRTLLDAFAAADQLARFVPFDVSSTTLRAAAVSLTDRYQGLAVDAVVGDFTRHLRHIPTDGRRLLVFLGGTIGNFYPDERRRFLDDVAGTLSSGEGLLLGVDLHKDVDRIVAAYHDVTGVSEAFNKNVLLVINRELGADFDTDAFTYIPFWNPTHSRVEMRLQATSPQSIRIGDLDLDVELAAGEEIRVEISSKFQPEDLAAEVAEAGFDVDQFWSGVGDFGLLLARRR